MAGLALSRWRRWEKYFTYPTEQLSDHDNRMRSQVPQMSLSLTFLSSISLIQSSISIGNRHWNRDNKPISSLDLRRDSHDIFLEFALRTVFVERFAISLLRTQHGWRCGDTHTNVDMRNKSLNSNRTSRLSFISVNVMVVCLHCVTFRSLSCSRLLISCDIS